MQQGSIEAVSGHAHRNKEEHHRQDAHAVTPSLIKNSLCNRPQQEKQYSNKATRNGQGQHYSENCL